MVFGCVSVVTAMVMLLQQAICPRNLKKRAVGHSIIYRRKQFLGDDDSSTHRGGGGGGV